MKQPFDPRQLVRWLGTDGARAGLMQSKRLTIDILRQTAESLDIKLPERTTRQRWIDEIIKVASKRIDKPIHELFRMDEQSLLGYFEDIEVGRAEILDVLKDASPRREGRRSLLEYAARELSETGRFMRIAGKQEGTTSVESGVSNGGKHDAQKRNSQSGAQPQPNPLRKEPGE